ncbi:DUF262 domain-containing protein [Flavobacterium sp. SLB02]|uniref:DUF262 domain-containing protein n=1 Tax=Flavobacterium sp. SLB02 TaxID=2665645 RepID=UPI001ABF26ED|nr:DUF262 domain-containing protein [Flavobacterium sp. SLB02]
MKDTYTLKEIANWQLDPDKSIVELPSIQRGFVWKPKQIEDLWDSILRGYPIGSFLFSKISNKLHLMDGQQRATSIFLGHFNPYNANDATKAWAIKGELPVVWLDIKPEVKPDTSKYLFRLTTRSHPWGYQAKNNDTKLTVSERRKALDLFQQHPNNKGGYTSFKNTTTFPFDSSYPIPLAFIIESRNSDDIIAKVEENLPDYFSTLRGGFADKNEFVSLLKTELKAELDGIFENLKQLSELKIKSNIIDDRVLQEENETENPTLFVRINSSGTTLNGDDLIYSIYKAIFPEAKNLMENIGLDFIAPTQVLSLASRLAASELEGNKFIKKINVRDFQRRIKNDDFKEGLKNQIQKQELKSLFAQAISILSCEDNFLFDGKVPPVIIKQFIKRNQDLFLFFVYWLHINKIELTDQIKLKMAGKLFSFAWFDFADIPRLWNEKINNKNFWEEPLNELIWWDDKFGIHFLIKPDLLRVYYLHPKVENRFISEDKDRWGLLEDGIGTEIMKYFNEVKGQNYDFPTANEYFYKFIGRIQHNRQLILLAQREYINAAFGDYNQMDDMDDTNVPWDWDHIYPSEWVYRKEYCNRSIRDWNNTNGNFRAMSLEQNRSESNSASPRERLSLAEIRDYSFIKEDWQYWQNLEKRIWDDEVQNHFRAITSRMINIYEKFWKDFKIAELINTSEKIKE